MTTLLLSTTLALFAAAPPTLPPPPVGAEDVDLLIAEGRALLDEGAPVEAEEVFRRAMDADGGSFRTELWVLRAWMDQGRSNDTLDRIDALVAAGNEGPPVDYLYGMAFVRRAEQNLANGVNDSSIRMNFEDGTDFLLRAVDADADRFRDAFLPLGRAAWHSMQLDEARKAIDRGVAYYPRDGETHLMKGRIALSQFQVAKGEEAIPVADWSEEIEAQWRAAHHSFSAAVKCFGEPREDTGRQYLLGLASVQLGHTLIWKGEREKAADAYATAIAWAPYAVDLGQVRGMLIDWNDPKPYDVFLSALEKGTAGFKEHFGTKNAGDATALWWLGYTQYERGWYKASEQAFLAAVTKYPAYTDAWVYVGMCRFNKVEYPGAVAAMQIGWALDPPAMVRVLSANPDYYLTRVSNIADWCYKEKRYLDAAILWEINAETAQTDTTYWNNAGLFLRDAADQIERREESPDTEFVRSLCERSYAAYQRALDLEPNNPQLMNDTAVLLHYYLEREFDKAMAMYQRAEELAMEQLADETLAEDLRKSYETALDDSRTNQKDLTAYLEKKRGTKADVAVDALEQD